MLLNISDLALFSCFPGAGLDLSAEDNVVALALAECPALPYAELIRSGIPSPSNLRSARSTASRPLPPSAMGVSPIGLTAATPIRGEILVQLGALSRKPRSAKRKKSSSTEKDRPVSVKVQKLGASPPSSIREPERAPSPVAEAPMVMSSSPSSKPATKAKNLLGWAVEQPLTVMPITVWNSPSESSRPPPRRVEELKRKKIRNQELVKMRTLCSSMLNSRQVQSRPSLRILTLGGRKCCPLMRLWLYPFRGLLR